MEAKPSKLSDQIVKGPKWAVKMNVRQLQKLHSTQLMEFTKSILSRPHFVFSSVYRLCKSSQHLPNEELRQSSRTRTWAELCSRTRRWARRRVLYAS